MDKKLEKEMNAQVTKELYSGYLYLAMAAYFETRNLSGFSRWMQFQGQEELVHGMKFFNYLNDRGCAVELGAFEKPPSNFKSVKDVFQKTLKHEQGVTASINNLYAIAQKVGDNASLAFLQWFVSEQVEEEKNPTDIIAKLDLINEDSAAILMLDKELGSRPQPNLSLATE